MFNVDDLANQLLADAYGIMIGSSHTGKWNCLFAKSFGLK
jgi:hypothetical protein